MWLMAFSSATHDIAADGLYMIALSKHDQAWFVGVRSTFYRIAMITGQGLLIIFAGYVVVASIFYLGRAAVVHGANLRMEGGDRVQRVLLTDGSAVDVDVVLETRNAEHVKEIIASLEQAGFPTRALSAHSAQGA